MRRLLRKIPRDFHDPSVVWPGHWSSEVAVILLEIGEDLHADAGLCCSLPHRMSFSPLTWKTSA
jgi:hypothetical protein